MELQGMIGMGKFVDYFRDKVNKWSNSLSTIEENLKDWLKYKDVSKHFYPILEEIITTTAVVQAKARIARCGECIACKRTTTTDVHACTCPLSQDAVDELYEAEKEKERKKKRKAAAKKKAK